MGEEKGTGKLEGCEKKKVG